MGKIGPVELLIILIPTLLIYFLPTIVALSRRKTNRTAIFLLNLLLGWTFVGWVVALVMACATNSQQTIIVNNNPNTFSENQVDSSQSSYDGKLDNLQKLKDLLDDGVLSQEEFEQQKAKILSS